MRFNIGSKIIGGYGIDKSFFLHIYNKDNNINVSYVLQFTKNIFKPWVTYEYGYRMRNLLFVRVGFNISEVD